MTQAITGTIAKKSVKNGTARNGRPYSLFSFQLVGNPTWYRTGFADCPFKEGQSISFVLNGKGDVDLPSVQAAAAPPPAAPGTPNLKVAAGAFGGGGQNRDGYWADKEARDIAREERYQTVDVPRMSYCSAQDRAVQLVSAALAADALSFGNAAKGKRLDMLLEYVDLVTDRFFLQGLNSPEHLVSLEKNAATTLSTAVVEDDNDYDVDWRDD